MGSRLRFAIAFALVGLLALPAAAAEFSSCWVAREWDPFYSEYQSVTRCRIAGGETVDYASDSSIPEVLYTNLGSDLTGTCWYLTTVPTDYVILAQYGDGSADIGYDANPSIAGGLIVVGPNIRRCTSEPTPPADPATDAWNYVTSYVHDPPTPDLNPQPGEGVTGLATYIGVPVPPDHAATISSGASTIDVEIEVDVVVVNWGDGAINTYPPNDQILAGYPDGTASHIYEVKSPTGVPLTVEYDWTARWRVSSGTWTALPVPNTTTTVDYPVAEVVSRLTD